MKFFKVLLNFLLQIITLMVFSQNVETINGNLEVNGTTATIGGNYYSTALNLTGTNEIGNSSTSVGINMLGYSGSAKGVFIRNKNNSKGWFIGKGKDYNGIGISFNGNSSSLEYKANTKFFIHEAGRVGIGTTNPEHGLLQINGNGYDKGITLWTNSGSFTSRIWLDDAKRNFHITRGSNATKGITISHEGKVGVATVNPEGNFNVASTRTIASTNLANASILIGSSALGIGIDDNEIQAKGQDFHIGTASNNSIFFQTSGPNKRMMIDKGGFVGIGVNSPSYNLHVYNQGKELDKEYLVGAFSTTRSGGVYLGYLADGTGASEARVRSGGNINLSLGTTRHTQSITIKNSNGFVGIGTTEPKFKFDVNGHAKIGGNLLIDGTDIRLGRDNSERSIGEKKSQRALVHYKNDALIVNYEGDFEGGIIVQGLRTVFTGNVAVNKKLEAKEIKVTNSPTADFVFSSNYNLPSIESVSKYVKEFKHLPEIASAKEMNKNGVNVGEFQIQLLQKIEELTLYTIEQEKQIKLLHKKIELNDNNFEKRLRKIESKLQK